MRYKQLNKALLAGVLVLATAAQSLAADKLKIIAAQRGNWETAIPELGQNAGIFKKHDVDLDILYTQGTGETMQLIVSGAGDLGLSVGILGVFGAYARGAPVRVVSAVSTGLQESFFYVRADSPVKTFRDAGGKTVAYATNGSSTQIAALSMIKLYGVDAKPVATGDANATFTQVMSGQVDIGWSTAPFQLDAMERGEVRLVGSAFEVPRVRGETSRVVIANAKNLGEKRDVINRYLRGFRETLDWLYSDPAAITRYKEFSGISESATRRMMKDFIPKETLQTAEVKGLKENMEDAIQFKFIAAPLGEAQIAELIQIQPGAKGQ